MRAGSMRKISEDGKGVLQTKAMLAVLHRVPTNAGTYIYEYVVMYVCRTYIYIYIYIYIYV